MTVIQLMKKLQVQTWFFKKAQSTYSCVCAEVVLYVRQEAFSNFNLNMHRKRL